MLAAEFKPRYLVVRHLIHCADLEVPPAPLGALETEQATPQGCGPLRSSGVATSLSGATGFGPQALNQLKRPPKLRLWGLLQLQGLR